MDQTKKRIFIVGYHHGKLNVLTSNYHLPLMNFSRMIVNWLPDSVYENIPHLWYLIYKEVKHIKNGTIILNMMKYFMYEVKRVAIEKFCQKSKMKDWDSMSKINVWCNFQNDFNIKYMTNNKLKKPSGKQFTIASHFQIYFRIPIMHSLKTHHKNLSQYIKNKTISSFILPFTLINLIF